MNADPRVTIELNDAPAFYAPGATLSGSYRLEDCEGRTIKRIELSVFWRTEGKGDEDRGVHHTETSHPGEDGRPGPGAPGRFAVRLPRSPLTYDGQLLRIKWCVQVKANIGGWRDQVAEAPFRLGNVPRAGDVPG